MSLNRYRYNGVRLYFHSSGRENSEYHATFLNRIGITHYTTYVEQIYTNVSYGMIRIYRGVDKSLARTTSRSILFDVENISFDASIVIHI